MEKKLKKNGQEVLSETFKLRISPSERAILDKYAEINQRSINQSIRLAIAPLNFTLDND